MNAPAEAAPKMLAERIPLDGAGAIDHERQRTVAERLRRILPEHAGARKQRERDVAPRAPGAGI